MKPEEQTPEKARRAQWSLLLMSLPLSVTTIWILASGDPFDGMNGIEIPMFLFGAFFFVSFTLVMLFTLLKKTDQEETAEILKSYESILFKGPLFLIVLGIIGVILIAFVGVLASIPLWAAIIIVLLLLK